MINLSETDQVLVNLHYARDLIMNGKVAKANKVITEAIQILVPNDAQTVDNVVLRLIEKE